MKRAVWIAGGVLILLAVGWAALAIGLDFDLPGAGVVKLWHQERPAGEMGQSVAGLGSDDETVGWLGGSGIIQSQAEVIVSAEIGGRLVKVGGDPGAEVEAGAILARLDEDLLLARIAQAQAGVEAAEANLARTQADARPPEIEAAQATVDGAQAEVSAARAGVDVAKANLEAAEARSQIAQAQLARLLAGASQGELAIAEQQIELAKVQLWGSQARRDAAKAGVDMPLSVPLDLDFGDSESLADFLLSLPFDWGGLDPEAIVDKLLPVLSEWDASDWGTLVLANPLAPRQLDVQTAEAGILNARSATDMAEIQFGRLQAGARAEDVVVMQAKVALVQTGVDAARLGMDQAEQAVSVAEAQLHQARSQLDLLRAGPAPAAVAVAVARMAEAQAARDILEAQRQKLTLRSPITGLVIERFVHEGETVVSGARLFIISTLDPVLVTVYVPVGQLGHVHLGQPADVSVSAYPGEAFAGEVVRIAPEAEFTPRNLQTREERTTVVFAVNIRIPNPDGRLRPGMPADAILR